jgi:hypothetical protein
MIWIIYKLILKLKWKFNYKHIRQRYAAYCKKITNAKDGDMIPVDWDVINIERLRNQL